MHFRIPREDLDLSRLRGDKPGEIDRIYLKIKLPETLARNLFERLPNHGKFPPPNPDRPYVRWVEFLETPNDAYMRARRFDLWSLRCRSRIRCTLDGSIGDLIRYSEVVCPTQPQPQDFMTDNSFEAWQKTAFIPEGCRVVRRNSYLSNSAIEDRGEKGVDVKCSANSCNLHMQIHGREITASIRVPQLEYAPQLVEVIRKQITQYVIAQGEDHDSR